MLRGKTTVQKDRKTTERQLHRKTSVLEFIGITTDKALNFRKHIENLCRTAQYKPHALRRTRKYLTLDKAKLFGNAFIDSQFNYAPLNMG